MNFLYIYCKIGMGLVFWSLDYLYL